jgi:hypothetical protein
VLLKLLPPVLLAVLLAGSSAQADASACIAAANEAPKLRADGKLRDARVRAVTCADAACPEIVRTECLKLVDELVAEIPTFVPSATDGAGNDLVDVVVELDGAKVADRLDGRAFPADPGAHVVRFRLGARVTEATVVFKVGEKRRIVAVAFGPEKSAEKQPETEKPLAAASETKAPKADVLALKTAPQNSPWPWILGVSGVVAGASGLVLQLGTAARARDLRATCAPFCDESEVDALRTRYWISGGLYAVSALAIGGAIWMHLAQRPSTTVAVTPTLSGANLAITF